jgi:hypothetical protein
MELEVHEGTHGVEIVLTNNSTSAARILWDRSAFVGVDGVADRLIITGQKYTNADQPASPTVIPPSATAVVFLVPASRVAWREGASYGTVFVPGAWETESILPATVKRQRFAVDQRVAELGGQAFRFFLFVEHPNFPTEIDIDIRIDRIAGSVCRRYKSGEMKCEETHEIYPSFGRVSRDE